jgi:hypothetical protein
MFRTDELGRIKYTEANLATLGFLTPNVVSKAVTKDASISASTEITLQKATTFISVKAIAKDVYLKWGTDDVTDSNMDEIVVAGEVRHFLVPAGVTAINVIEAEASATCIIIEK